MLLKPFLYREGRVNRLANIFLTECLKVSRLLDILLSIGTVCQSLAADTEKEFSNRDVLKLGICNN